MATQSIGRLIGAPLHKIGSRFMMLRHHPWSLLMMKIETKTVTSSSQQSIERMQPDSFLTFLTRFMLPMGAMR